MMPPTPVFATLRGTLAGLCLLVSLPAWGANGDLSVSSPALNSSIEVRTCAKYAGAVCSVLFRGKEHIDTRDAGRLLQSASFFDYYDECLNPTEGGAERDRFRSTSVLKAASAEGNRIRTQTNMAYWLRPRQDHPRGCGRHKDVKRALNEVAVSGHLLSKEITIGMPGFPNVIVHRVTFHVPSSHAHAVFEASTGYMPKEFSLALYVDPATGDEREAGKRQGEQSLPVVLATPDRGHAMGVYSPQLPQGKRGYGRFSFPDVVKWNCVFREDHVKPGSYSYRCLIPVGTVDEVKDTIQRLYVSKGAGKRRDDNR